MEHLARYLSRHKDTNTNTGLQKHKYSGLLEHLPRCYVTDPSKVVSDQMTSLFLCGHKAQSTPNVISINASVINAIINNASVINTRVTNVIIINTSVGKGIDEDQYRQCIVYIILSPAPGPIVT